QAFNDIIKLRDQIEILFSDANKSATNNYRLSDKEKFTASIGKRVITGELSSKGEIPIYSANVFEPFGYINNLLIEDFTIPSVLWGIDGDWMVNYMPENKPFYPTDHCGVLRVFTDDVLPKYLAWVLLKEGQEKKFSRQLRASIDRITGITIKVPSIEVQKSVIAEVELLENQIKEQQKVIDGSTDLKNAVLKKYL
ncbi:MAG: restriction endonuclease subunit S, partial [Rikenellaceae bacterium]|nr:restriction endonuclease subunit S [Rikenellaceae bacterium]